MTKWDCIDRLKTMRSIAEDGKTAALKFKDPSYRNIKINYYTQQIETLTSAINHLEQCDTGIGF